jgi:PKD repeat protein
LRIIGCLVALFFNYGCSEDSGVVESEDVHDSFIQFSVSPIDWAIVHVTRVTCNIKGEGAGLKYEWDFGDGYMSREAHPTHIYTIEGSYVITLTATDKGGVTHYSFGYMNAYGLNGAWSARGNPADTYFVLVQSGATLKGADYVNGKVVDALIGQISDPFNVTWTNSSSEFAGTVTSGLDSIAGTVKNKSGGSASVEFWRR